MTTAGAFGVEGVDRPALEGGDRVLDEARLVERVGVDHYLDVELVGDRQTAVDRRRCCSPVLVELERRRAALDLLLERRGQRGIALAGEGEVHRKALRRLDH